MNQSQIGGYIRTLLAFIGGAIASFFVAKGWVTADTVAAISSSPLFDQAVGYVVGAISLGFVGWWSKWTKTPANLMTAAVAAMPAGSTQIVTTKEIAAATPGVPEIKSNTTTEVVQK